MQIFLELSKPAILIQVEPSEPDFRKYFVSQGISPSTHSTSGLTENVSRDPDQNISGPNPKICICLQQERELVHQKSIPEQQLTSSFCC
jgi:hypothetical protein